jgi:diguanylate cyclase (GGDEF)-like protein
MTGSATPAPDAGAPASDTRAPLGRLRRASLALRSRRRDPRRHGEVQLARILDLFEEHVYAGEITPDGRYVHHVSPISIANLIGGPLPDDVLQGAFWESRILPSDWPLYEAFNRRLLDGEDAEVTYRLAGLDGVTRTLRDRARPRRTADGGILVEGIVSDVTAQQEAAIQLAEASGRFTSLLDVVGAHVYLTLALPDGTLQELFQGPGGDRLLGGAEPDPEMVNWDAAVHPDDRDAFNAFNQGLCRGEDGDVTYRLIGADGITRWVQDRAACRLRPDGAFEVSGIVSDVTERRRLEDDLKRSMQEMQRAHRELEHARAAAELRASTDELTATFNRRRFAEIAAESIAAGHDRCALLLLDADHFKQINDAYGHAAGDAVLVGLARRLGGALGPGDCLARWGGEEFAVLLREVESDRDLAARAERLRRAVDEVPIVVHGDLRVELTVSVGCALAADRSETLDALLERADRCLYAAKYEGRNRVSAVPTAGGAGASAAESEALGLARTLAFASSMREGVPEEHSEQVATLAAGTALHLGLPQRTVERCRLGGWLHDIGKLAISDQILTKPGPLDDAEWERMRAHPAVGAAVVMRVAALRHAAAGVRHHHERFAGGGYPDDLAGTAIPIEARIIAAADAYAAMTANRPYSAARTPEEAAAELRRSAGSHLDPAVVDSLLAIIGLDDESLQNAA